MTNQYHDAAGRFCSKGEMKSIVDDLGAQVVRGGSSEILDQWIEMKDAYQKASASESSDASAFRAPTAKPKAPARIQHEALSELMEFGAVVTSNGSGSVTANGYDHSQYVEEIQYVYSEEDGSTDEPDAPAGWEYLRGFTNQYSYNGPVMHSSEFMGGALAEHIIDNPGTYATVMIEALPVDLDGNEEAEPVGWAVLHRIEAPAEAKVTPAEKERRRESAKELMEFGRVIQVGKEGVPFPALNGLGLSTAPEEIQYVDLDGDGGAPDPVAPKGWEYLRGFTNQQGYRGPIMHDSEFIGGGLADHILENPGFYSTVLIEGMQDPEDPEYADGDTVPVGWGVLRYVGEQSN